MTTPAIILGMLIAPLLIGSVLNRMTQRQCVCSTVLGCVGITLVFCFTGVGHFIKTEPMAEMLPPWVPGRIPLVYVTGASLFGQPAEEAKQQDERPVHRRDGLSFLPAQVVSVVDDITHRHTINDEAFGIPGGEPLGELPHVQLHQSAGANGKVVAVQILVEQRRFICANRDALENIYARILHGLYLSI